MLFLGILFLFVSKKIFRPSVHVVIDAKVSSPDTFQVFYDTGKGFSEEESVRVAVDPSTKFQSIVFNIPIIHTKNLRIDIGSENKKLEIRNMQITKENNSLDWDAQDILNEFSSFYQFKKREVRDGALYIETTGNDPQILYEGDITEKMQANAVSKNRTHKIIILLFFITYIATLFYFRKAISNREIRLVSSENTSEEKRNVCFIIAFILLLSIPISQMVFKYLPEKDFQEQRELTASPDLNLLTDVSTWHAYTASIESFFNDHYGLRNSLIHANSVLNIKYFNISPRIDIILGKDGWLFYDSPSDGVSMKDYYGKVPYSETELIEIKTNLLRLKNKLDARNIDLVMVLVPNKNTIYEEFLPNYIQQKRGSFTRADQVHVVAKELGLHFIDTRTVLLDAKKTYPYPLYYKTDSHWNNLGAYIAVKEVLQEIGDMGYATNTVYKKKDPIIYSKDNFNIHDLSKYINSEIKTNDPEIIIDLKRNYEYKEIKHPIYNQQPDSYVETSLKNLSYPKAVIFRDSFAIRMIPYLSESFSKAVYVWNRNIDFTIINKEKPDIVIIEFVERYSQALLLESNL